MTHPFNKMHQWVGSPVDYCTGQTAQDFLTRVNDNRYWDGEKGSVLVDQERWEQAQQYEYDTWMRYGLSAHTDRDHQHTANFGNYEIVPHHLHKLVEIGCGPFTQTYNVINSPTTGSGPRLIDSITLVDPLLEKYCQHPNCRYDRLGCTPICKAIPAEDFSDTGFDIAICINVLEHVRDATKVMENLVNCLRTDGILIFHDRTYDGLDITKIYDVGHPIRITTKFLESFLKQFTPLRVHGDYFIGQKE